MNIRVFSETDAEELSRVILETLYVSNSRDYSKAILDKRAPKYSPHRLIEKAKTRYVLVAEEKGKIIGTAQLDKDNIKAMFVHPSMQGKGVGKALVNCIEVEARRRGIDKIIGDSSLTAVNFYRKLGFKIGKELESEGVRGFYIEKQLSGTGRSRGP